MYAEVKGFPEMVGLLRAETREFGSAGGSWGGLATLALLMGARYRIWDLWQPMIEERMVAMWLRFGSEGYTIG